MRCSAPLRCSAAARAVAKAAAALLACAMVALAACERARIENSAAVQFPRSAQEMEFLEALEKQIVVTNNDALHGLIVFADGTDLATTYEGRVEIARKHGWVGDSWNPPGDRSAQIGWMAVAGCQVVGIKGGLTMRIFGLSPRYCTKELVFMNVLPLRTENQSLSGKEFIDYLNRLGRVQTLGRPMALTPEEDQAGVGAIPAGAANQLLDQSAVEFGLPTTAPKPVPAPAPTPESTP